MPLSFAIIIPTKDRPKDIRTVLADIAKQSLLPDRLIVVDSSVEPNSGLPSEFPGLPLTYIRYEGKPSASAQRNAGIQAVGDGIDLVGFVDDDITFAPDAFRNMLAFWETAPAETAGVAFNCINSVPIAASRLKRTRLIQWLGLYHPEPGRVLRSGWHTVIQTVDKNIETEWLISGACLWRRQILGSGFFDPFFDGYSYLEDLDSSYGIHRRGGRLFVLSNAGYYHWHSPTARSSAVQFGMVETRNRLHFVRKNGLSLSRCTLVMLVRWLMTLGSGNIGRARGNLLGIFSPSRISK